MLQSRLVRTIVGLSIVLLGLAAAGPLHAETLLVTARETVDGKDSPPPLPSLEGASSGLYEKGHIVFDAGSKAAEKKITELTEAARSGGAGWLLKIEVSYSEKPLEQGVTRVEGSASFTLIDTSTGATSLAGSVKDSNQGREKTIDRRTVGIELGKLVTDRVTKAIPSPAL